MSSIEPISTQSGASLKLYIRQLGHVPSKKNSKMLARGRLITAPKIQEWVKKCIKAFASQLSSGTQTGAEGTWTAHFQQSWICLLPFDDNWTVVPKIHLEAIQVGKGEEGADILLEEICTTEHRNHLAPLLAPDSHEGELFLGITANETKQNKQ